MSAEKKTKPTVKKSATTSTTKNKKSSSKSSATEKKTATKVRKTSKTKVTSATATHSSESTTPKNKGKATTQKTTAQKSVRKAKKPSKKPPASTRTKEKEQAIKFPFEVGDYVFYPNEGLGHIIGTEQLMLQGVRTPYYIVEFPAQKMINHIPVQNCKKVKLRKIVSKSTARNIMKVFEVDQQQFDLAWKDRLLLYQKINNKGSIVEMAQMLTALFKRKLIKNNLSFQERQVFDFALESISNELAIVLGKTHEDMQAQIIDKLTETFKDLT